MIDDLSGYEKTTIPGMLTWHFGRKEERGYRTLCGLQLVNRTVAYRDRACVVCQAKAREIKEEEVRA